MIAIVGSGNVAHHLYEALKGKTEVKQVNSRTLQGMPVEPDLILMCVSDDAIAEVAEKLRIANINHEQSQPILVHTAGSVSMDVLKDKSDKIGVFYPLQTFSKESDLDYSCIPVFIEGNTEEVKEKLREVAELITQDIRYADSATRQRLHLASVFACNFTNAMAIMAEDILKDTGLPFSTLLPLMHQTVKKLDHLEPKASQTGPAKRNDRQVIEHHLEMLEKHGEEGVYAGNYLKDIYALISDYIQETTKPNKDVPGSDKLTSPSCQK